MAFIGSTATKDGHMLCCAGIAAAGGPLVLQPDAAKREHRIGDAGAGLCRPQGAPGAHGWERAYAPAAECCGPARVAWSGAGGSASPILIVRMPGCDSRLRAPSSAAMASCTSAWLAIENRVNERVCDVVSKPPMRNMPISAISCASDSGDPAHRESVSHLFHLGLIR